MATRLTKDAREEILEAVMKATTLKAQEESITKRTSELATRITLPKVPSELLALTKQHPREWFRWGYF